MNPRVLPERGGFYFPCRQKKRAHRRMRPSLHSAFSYRRPGFFSGDMRYPCARILSARSRRRNGQRDPRDRRNRQANADDLAHVHGAARGLRGLRARADAGDVHALIRRLIASGNRNAKRRKGRIRILPWTASRRRKNEKAACTKGGYCK